MSGLSVEACLALRELGYPQENWPQMVWSIWIPATSLMTPKVEWLATRPTEGFYGFGSAVPRLKGHIAAPDALTALDWLEREHDWKYERRNIWAGHDGSFEGIEWAASGWVRVRQNNGHVYRRNAVLRGYRTPDALILAIAEHHRQFAAQASVEAGRV